MARPTGKDVRRAAAITRPAATAVTATAASSATAAWSATAPNRTDRADLGHEAGRRRAALKDRRQPPPTTARPAAISTPVRAAAASATLRLTRSAVGRGVGHGNRRRDRPPTTIAALPGIAQRRCARLTIATRECIGHGLPTSIAHEGGTSTREPDRDDPVPPRANLLIRPSFTGTLHSTAEQFSLPKVNHGTHRRGWRGNRFETRPVALPDRCPKTRCGLFCLPASLGWRHPFMGADSEMKLQGQMALVTGAARGIGRGCALELARAGADIAINDRVRTPQLESVAAEICALGRRSAIVDGDIFQRPTAEQVVARCR